MTETLGMRWDVPTTAKPARSAADLATVNTRNALWPERWPAIALQSCIDTVESAPVDQQAEVKFNLPCMSCPERGRCLNAKRKEIGSLMYSREILTHPRTSDSSLFPRDLFAPLMIRNESFVPFWRKPFGVEHEYAVVQAWDIAWSEKTGGDWLVCMSGYVHRESGRRRLLDISRWQKKSFAEQIGLIQSQHRAFGADMVVIEGDAAQAVWKQQVATTTDVPVVKHFASDGKQDLANGVPGLLILLENRKWEFPEGPEGSYHRGNLDVFLDEAEAFGWVDGKLQGIGEHDDTVMGWWHLNWGMRRFVNDGSEEFHRGVQPGRYN